MNCYALFDVVSESFSTPFFTKLDGEAKRMFINLMHDETEANRRTPEDYAVFKLAEFDHTTGQLKVLENHEKIISGVEAVVEIQRRIVKHQAMVKGVEDEEI